MGTLNKGHILIADVDVAFAQSTAALLVKLGYDCDLVFDSQSVVKRLEKSSDDFDVLVANVNMPGNLELELVDVVAKKALGLSIILVNESPTMVSAAKLVSSPVFAFLIKPVNLSELAAFADQAIRRRQAMRAIESLRNRSVSWNHLLDQVDQMLVAPPAKAEALPIGDFLNLTLHNIVGSLMDVLNVIGTTGRISEERSPCHLLSCPRTDALTSSLREAVHVLHRTKSSFKSKELADLRRKLELVIGESTGDVSGSIG